jgi:hypothetical protein
LTIAELRERLAIVQNLVRTPAKKAYKDALEKQWPLSIKQMLDTQYAHIQTSHDYVKAARDSRK